MLAADPNNAPALHYSGVVLFQAGKIPEAAERIRASLKLEPTSPDAWSNLALVLDSAGRREAAVNALKEAAKFAPASPQILAQPVRGGARDRTHRRTPRRRRAARSLPTRATRRVGTISRWRWSRRAGCWKRWTPRRVQPRSRPAEPAYAGFKAQLEITAGMRKKARTTLDAALARNPAPRSLQFELAGLLERENDPAGAMQAYENAVRLDPKHGAALSQLLFLRQRLGDWHDLANLRKRFHDGVAAGTPLLSPFVLLSQPSSRQEQRRCADAWTAALAPPAAAPGVLPLNAATPAHRLPFRGFPCACHRPSCRGFVRAA